MVPTCKPPKLIKRSFRRLISNRVEKLFLVVWPPLGESKASDIDVSFGFVFHHSPNRLCIVTTDRADMWTPRILFSGIPKTVYTWEVFLTRIQNWMSAREKNDYLEVEYYDVTEAQSFQNIVSYEILSVELISVASDPNPFGVRFVFHNDYILSTPISDGNTVESLHFNKHGNIKNFAKIGDFRFDILV